MVCICVMHLDLVVVFQDSQERRSDLAVSTDDYFSGKYFPHCCLFERMQRTSD